jgi:pSer/pThr/pTyr-binding forkhead associated (FHA) protein
VLELTITAGAGQFLRRVELTGERPITIGRARECDIRIANPMVSRHHAEIRKLEDGHWILRDLGSTHGCFVNGNRVNEARIVSGLEARIGPAKLVFDNLATRIGRELDAMISDDDEGPEIEIIASNGRRAQPMDETIH